MLGIDPMLGVDPAVSNASKDDADSIERPEFLGLAAPACGAVLLFTSVAFCVSVSSVDCTLVAASFFSTLASDSPDCSSLLLPSDSSKKPKVSMATVAALSIEEVASFVLPLPAAVVVLFFIFVALRTGDSVDILMSSLSTLSFKGVLHEVGLAELPSAVVVALLAFFVSRVFFSLTGVEGGKAGTSASSIGEVPRACLRIERIQSICWSSLPVAKYINHLLCPMSRSIRNPCGRCSLSAAIFTSPRSKPASSKPATDVEDVSLMSSHSLISLSSLLKH
mmetsp:Transcript_40757/g.75764  ORF Transcript_40757/g.75764 Transcript_40757/m.75764 type:complete len:279 (-) Transcript_40757:340-1176(-)